MNLDEEEEEDDLFSKLWVLLGRGRANKRVLCLLISKPTLQATKALVHLILFRFFKKPRLHRLSE
jgi:hypothetical protein